MMIVKFVAAPTTTAAVRMDLARDTVHVKNNDGFTLGHPSFDGNPLTIGVDYGYRSLQMTVQVNGSKATALTELQALAREIVRRDNWLLVQLAPDVAPVWLRTYRGEPGDLSIENAGVDVWEISVPLTCEGFAYGAREVLSLVTVNNNPAAGSNPCYMTLPAIKGDAPAQLRVQINPSNTDYMNGFRWMLASAATIAAAPPVIWQVGGTDGWTAGTDTSASTSNAAYSGGSYRAVSFATQTGLLTRLSGAAPAALPRGLYKVLVRVARSDTSSTFWFRFGQVVAALVTKYGKTVTMTRAASTASGHATWVDLGDFNFPWGITTSADFSTFDSTPQIELQVGRLSGSGSCNVDAFMLVPLNRADQSDARVLFSEFPDAGLFISTGFGVWDGDDQLFWAVDQFGTLVSAVPELAGYFPCAYPGLTNQLVILQQANGRKSSLGTDSSDDITVSSDVTVSYYPRYLNLRGD